MSEVTTNWDKLVEMLGQTLQFAGCDEHLSNGLRAIEGKTGRVVRVTDQENVFCIDGHAPAAWLFYKLGRGLW